MAPSRSADSSSWLPKPTSTSNIHPGRVVTPFRLDRRLLAKRSARVATLLNEKPNEDSYSLLHDIPGDAETFELVARFCHGFDVDFSSDNIIPLICLAEYLMMTESHSADNLLKKARVFFKQRILPSWNETIKSLLLADHVIKQAMQLHLVDACVESLSRKALAHPNLLGEPTRDLTCDGDGQKGSHRNGTNARKLFVRDQKSEELALLPLHLYEPIIQGMIHHGVPPNYVAGSLLKYIERWICSDNVERSCNPREVIEAVERLLPSHKNLLSCTLLFEMLSIAVTFNASFLCKNGFENRIGKQLDQASVRDLFIPTNSLCFGKEVQYNIESVRRIMQSFYENFTSTDASGLAKVAKLMEEFLAEAASDGELKTSDFLSLADLSVSASKGIDDHCSDGIYRGVDIFLDKHRGLTESERENVCQVIDFHKMSPEACHHAALNQMLPLRVVVQALFVSQLQLRDVITTQMQQQQQSGELVKMTRIEGGVDGNEEDDTELEGDGKKLLEFEESGEMIEDCCCHRKKEKVSLWREMKRKLGCVTSIHDCNCQVKKKKVAFKV